MNIAEAIRKFLIADPIYAGIIPADVSLDHPLIDSGALDSIGIFNLVSFLEKTFSIAVEPQDLNEAHFASIRTIEQFVKSRMK